MIYLDTSVLLARLFAEDRFPPEDFWQQPLVSSRLIEYETWTRVHARKRSKTHGEAAKALLARVALLELAPAILVRAMESFPTPVRTLDALHLASAHFIRAREPALTLATYDEQMAIAASALGLVVSAP